jgi:hypothetical protein
LVLEKLVFKIELSSLFIYSLPITKTTIRISFKLIIRIEIVIILLRAAFYMLVGSVL